MDPVLSGSLCFLVLAIVMYIKFIRAHPWSDDDDDNLHLDHKSSPVEPDDMDDDAVPFLHPSSPVGVLHKHKHKQTKQVRAKQQQSHLPQKQPLHPLHPTGLGVLQHTTRQQQQQQHVGGGGSSASAMATATGTSSVAAAAQHYPGYLHKQPMRRRTHSATAPQGTSSSVADSAGDAAIDSDQHQQLPTTTQDALPVDLRRRQQPSQIHQRMFQPPPSTGSGRGQHRINFANLDELDSDDSDDLEMYASPSRRRSSTAPSPSAAGIQAATTAAAAAIITSTAGTDASLESVPFEATDDDDCDHEHDEHDDSGFLDLESSVPPIDARDLDDLELYPSPHPVAVAATGRPHSPTAKRRRRQSIGNIDDTDALLTMKSATDPKTALIERQFVRSVAQPAQMQLEVARKARIPLFLHSPMYVKTSAPPINDIEPMQLLAVGGNAIAAQQPHRIHSPPRLDHFGGTELPDGIVNDGGGGAAGANAGGYTNQLRPPGGGGGGMTPRRRERLPAKCKTDNSSLHIAFSELTVGELIGQGAFGTVHRATWRGTTVAVKILVCQYITTDILEEFETEVQIMSILRHPNICLLMGACLEPPTRCLVIEYLPRGSLWNVLRQDTDIDYRKQTSIARDTALGMNYLHSFQPPILHRDLKSPNLLVDLSYAIKISDFGLARVRAHFQTMTGNCGTTQWMAPEVLAAEKYTEKADVFSYGVVVWETVTRECPYEGLSQIQAALGVLNNNLRPTIPPTCPPLLKTLMTRCWASKPEERPTFEAILDMLHHSQVASDAFVPMRPTTATT